MRPITAERLDERLPSRAVHDEIGRLTEVLNDMFDRLDTSFRQAARFSADASHELKTPLTVLRAGVENLLASKELSPADQASVAVLLEQTHRLTSITESLLLLARADGGRLKLDYATACVSELISACMDDAQIMAEPRGIQISAVVPPALPATVDSKRVSQIVLNLLDNAVKHNVDGGRVAVEAKRVGVIIVVTVGNSGPGISPADCRKLFQRFFRAKSNTETDGAGLGLSIARELARAHFGDLELVQSRDGWTTFQFRLLAPVPASEHGNGRLPSEALV